MKKLKIGMEAILSRKVTAKDVQQFADLSLDYNPIHFDNEFAKKSFFRKPIAHGMIGASLISGCLTKLMGSGNIWLSADYTFLKPIFIDDTLSVTLVIKDISRRGVAKIEVKIKNQSDDLLIEGHVKSMSFAMSQS